MPARFGRSTWGWFERSVAWHYRLGIRRVWSISHGLSTTVISGGHPERPALCSMPRLILEGDHPSRDKQDPSLRSTTVLPSGLYLGRRSLPGGDCSVAQHVCLPACLLTCMLPARTAPIRPPISPTAFRQPACALVVGGSDHYACLLPHPHISCFACSTTFGTRLGHDGVTSIATGDHLHCAPPQRLRLTCGRGHIRGAARDAATEAVRPSGHCRAHGKSARLWLTRGRQPGMLGLAAHTEIDELTSLRVPVVRHLIPPGPQIHEAR
jgi:hypothetical protein